MIENNLTISLKRAIQDGRWIESSEILINEVNNLGGKLTTDEFLKKKEHPSTTILKKTLEDYESETTELIKLVLISSNYEINKNSNDIYIRIIKKMLGFRKNNEDSYGYIWAHISNYPLLLVTYSIGIMSLYFKKYNLLFDLFNIEIEQRYLNDSFVDKFKSMLIEGINSYHLFNNIENINVDVIQYFPKYNSNGNGSANAMRIEVNHRVYNYLEPLMESYFINKKEFSDYFDLYEFFLGLVFMDQRLVKDNLVFAPYGRHYWKYSGSGRYFNSNDSIVNDFINETIERKNKVLEVGFFNNDLQRFNNSIKEYQNLLSRIYI
ncbi:MAG: hypothetical protein ABI840_07625 [bacterium]